MTGRHRGQPKGTAAADEVDEAAPRGRRAGVVAGAIVVPALLAGLIAFWVGGGSSDKGTEREPARQAAPATTPAGEPTYGKYVPPEPEPQVATKAPPRPAPVPETTPRRANPTPTPSPTPTRTQRACPPGWEDVWWMRRWCERRGDRDGPGHRGR